MSRFYNAQRRRNLYDPNSGQSYRISRSKIDLYLDCPRCFYLDRRLGVGRPPGFPFNLNSAVDKLLKKEFDIHRAEGSPHPLMKTYGIDNVVPFAHEDIDKWRDALRRGITYLEPKTNLLITGGIDDVWKNDKDELMIVDYKATSKDGEVNIDADWQISYKRQMEIYQWLFRKNNFKVSPTGYFVYCNGITDKKAFDGKLEFDIKIIPYEGDDSWIEGAIGDIYKCLQANTIPVSNPECDHCNYRAAVNKIEQ